MHYLCQNGLNTAAETMRWPLGRECWSSQQELRSVGPEMPSYAAWHLLEEAGGRISEVLKFERLQRSTVQVAKYICL